MVAPATYAAPVAYAAPPAPVAYAAPPTFAAPPPAPVASPAPLLETPFMQQAFDFQPAPCNQREEGSQPTLARLREGHSRPQEPPPVFNRPPDEQRPRTRGLDPLASQDGPMDRTEEMLREVLYNQRQMRDNLMDVDRRLHDLENPRDRGPPMSNRGPPMDDRGPPMDNRGHPPFGGPDDRPMNGPHSFSGHGGPPPPRPNQRDAHGPGVAQRGGQICC